MSSDYYLSNNKQVCEAKFFILILIYKKEKYLI